MTDPLAEELRLKSRSGEDLELWSVLPSSPRLVSDLMWRHQLEH